jgi:hypothetical protein
MIMHEVPFKKVLFVAFFGAAGAAALGAVFFSFFDAVLYHFVYDMAGRYDRGGEFSVHVIATIGGIVGGVAGVIAGRYMAHAGFCHSRHMYVGGVLVAAMILCLALEMAAHDLIEPWDFRWSEIWLFVGLGAAAGGVLGGIGHHCWLAAGGKRPRGSQRWQFSIGELLVWMAVFAVLVGPLVGVAGRRYSFFDQRRAKIAPLPEHRATIQWHSPTSTNIDDVKAVRFWGIMKTSAEWDEVWTTLRQFRNLEELEFFSAPLRDADFERLKQFKSLRVLSLRHCPNLSDAGLQHIGEMSGLEQFELTNANITGAGLKHLHGLKRLRRCDIFPHNHLVPGLRKLKAALPECEFQWDP